MGEKPLGQVVAEMNAKEDKYLLERMKEAKRKLEEMTPKPKLLFLDDRSKRLHAALKKYGDDYDVTLVCTAKECIKMLSNEGPWDVVSLDHDLDFDEFVPSILPNTGMEVVRWLIEEDNINFLRIRGRKIGEIWLHSSNQSAAYAMHNRLREVGYEAYVARFEYDD